jgi:hypothetical protein
MISSYNVANSNQCMLEPFNTVLEHLLINGWQMVDSCDNSNKVSMNKKYKELQEICIEYKHSRYHITVPINNSVYSYYKHFTNLHNSINFLTNYIDNINQ